MEKLGLKMGVSLEDSLRSCANFESKKRYLRIKQTMRRIETWPRMRPWVNIGVRVKM